MQRTSFIIIVFQLCFLILFACQSDSKSKAETDLDNLSEQTD